MEVHLELVHDFWTNAIVSNTEIRGDILGKEVIVSEVTIFDATQCWLGGAKYSKKWTDEIGGTDDVLDILLKDPTTTTKKIVAF